MTVAVETPPKETAPVTLTSSSTVNILRDAAKLEKACTDFLYWKGVKEGAKKLEDESKEQIIAQLEAYGVVPDNAPKSKRISTSGHVATMTTGTSVEIDDNAAAGFEKLLREHRLSKLFNKIFTSRSEYSLVKNAHLFITTHKWPTSIGDKVLSAYLRCFSAKTNAPSLNVETHVEIEKRAEAALAELAAKAAKKHGKAGA